MSLSVSSATTPVLPATSSPNSTAASVAGGASGQTSTASTAQLRAKLNQMVAQYTSLQSNNGNASQLAALAKQIAVQAKTLGVNVQLPSAPSSAPAGRPASATTGVNVTA